MPHLVNQPSQGCFALQVMYVLRFPPGWEEPKPILFLAGDIT